MRVKNKGIIITGCCLLLLTGCQKADKPTDYELGAKELKAGQYEEAIGSFEMSIAEKKDEVMSYRGAGIAYLRMSNYQEAVASFGKALSEVDAKDKSLKKDILYYMATAQYKNNSLKETIETCDRILEMGVDQNACFLRGVANLEQDSYEAAVEDFNKYLKDSSDYEAYLNVYRIYEKKDMTADGETFLEKALHIDNKDEDNSFQRGRIYYYLQDYEKAKSELINSMNDGNKEAAFMLGKVYVAMEDTANARIMYQQYMDDNGESAKSYNGLAYCDIAEGSYDSALQNIQKGLALASEGDKQSLLFNEIVAYEKKMDFATAREKAAAYQQQYPTDEAAIKESQFLQTR